MLLIFFPSKPQPSLFPYLASSALCSWGWLQVHIGLYEVKKERLVHLLVASPAQRHCSLLTYLVSAHTPTSPL